MAQRDCLVVMATGSGKSIWYSITKRGREGRETDLLFSGGVWGGVGFSYQLPALVSGKTAVVISPLISLMQDQVSIHAYSACATWHTPVLALAPVMPQVMSLQQKNIRAEFLGSSQTDRRVEGRACCGQYDIIYLTPEKALNMIGG